MLVYEFVQLSVLMGGLLLFDGVYRRLDPLVTVDLDILVFEDLITELNGLALFLAQVVLVAPEQVVLEPSLVRVEHKSFKAAFQISSLECELELFNLLDVDPV